MLRKITSILLISLSIFILLYNEKCIKNRQDAVQEIIENKINPKYDGFMIFSKLNYKLLIKKGDYNGVLDSNLVLMINDRNVFNNEFGNIILAGHNNKYVFSKLYKLYKNDEIIISDFENTYSYIVEKRMYINIKDRSILDNVYDRKILTLITCTNNNQIRYVVRARLNHIISHN